MAQSGGAPQKANGENKIDPGTLIRVAAVLAALAYGTGVVAINTYLHGLGITDFSFAKPKLLLTGALVLGSFLLLASAPIFIAWSYCVPAEEKPTTQLRSRQMLFVGIVALAILIFSAIMLCFRLETPLGEIQGWWIWEHLSKQSGPEKSWAVLLIVLGVFGPGCSAAFFGFKAKHYWMAAKPDTGRPCIPLEYFHFAGAMLMALLSIIGYIMIFTFVFYPSVPVEFGGGEPYFESFAIADDQICAWKQIGIPFDANRPGITKPLPVLHQTDSLVAVWLQGKLDPRQKPESASPATGEGVKVPTPDGGPEAEVRDPIHGKDPSGLGEFEFVVVQLNQNAIIAARAYPHWKKVPALNKAPAACKNGVTPVEPLGNH